MPKSRFIRPKLVVAVATLGALTLSGGVAHAVSLDSDHGSPVDGLPIIGDGEPDVCSVTSSDPRRKQTCNQSGGYGRDGADGEVRGHRSRDDADRHSRAQRYSRSDPGSAPASIGDDQADLEPDVNGAPGRRGAPRAVTAPGSSPHPF